jgi:iron(III) transport system substrate-binding protein
MSQATVVAVAGALVASAMLVLLVVLPRRPGGRTRARVLTDRTESHLGPAFASFERETGIRVEALYLDKGLLSRLESRPTEADVVITKDAELLEMARVKGLLATHGSGAIREGIPPRFRDPSGTYFSDSYRARAIFYSKDRVRPEDLSTYESLADPKWRGRVCVRSGYHDYNLSLFGQMMSYLGADRTRRFLEGLASNLARTPGGDDRGQVRAIHEGTCDVAIANSYYMGIMLSSADQRAWGLSTRVFFPNQGDQGGTLVLRSGLALTRSRANAQAATALLEHMARRSTQQAMATLTFAYPVLDGIPLPDVTRALGAEQPGVSDGVFRIRHVPIDEIARNRESVLRMLDEVRFDRVR